MSDLLTPLLNSGANGELTDHIRDIYTSGDAQPDFQTDSCNRTPGNYELVCVNAYGTPLNPGIINFII